MDIIFQSFQDLPPGTVARLLSEAYARAEPSDPEFWMRERAHWVDYDRKFMNPQIRLALLDLSRSWRERQLAWRLGTPGGAQLVSSATIVSSRSTKEKVMEKPNSSGFSPPFEKRDSRRFLLKPGTIHSLFQRSACTWHVVFGKWVMEWIMAFRSSSMNSTYKRECRRIATQKLHGTQIPRHSN